MDHIYIVCKATYYILSCSRMWAMSWTTALLSPLPKRYRVLYNIVCRRLCGMDGE